MAFWQPGEKCSSVRDAKCPVFPGERDLRRISAPSVLYVCILPSSEFSSYPSKEPRIELKRHRGFSDNHFFPSLSPIMTSLSHAVKSGKLLISGKQIFFYLKNAVKRKSYTDEENRLLVLCERA